MIKPLHNIFLRIATEDSRKLKLSDGTELFFDDSYNENWHRQQIGQIAYLPEKYSASDNEVPLFVGDIVYFHHLATQDAYKVVIEGETLYMQPIEQIYGVKRDGKIICLNSIVFIEQLTESLENLKTKSGIILKEAPDEIKCEGTVVALPPSANDWNILGEDMKFTAKIKVGSHVKFQKRSEFEIKADFGTRKIYRMPLANVLMVMN